METPVVVFHGFSQEHTIALMRAVKKAAAELQLEPTGIAFATSTPNNLDWTLRELCREVAEEHAYMKANPPGGGKLA